MLMSSLYMSLRLLACDVIDTRLEGEEAAGGTRTRGNEEEPDNGRFNTKFIFSLYSPSPLPPHAIRLLPVYAGYVKCTLYTEGHFSNHCLAQ